MELLERKGMLRNSLVVVLSDHGEALGLPQTDALIRGNTVREILDGYRISLWGHGSSVLSPHQFAAFLALRGYGSVDLPHAFHEYDAPVSLVDIAPTALDLLGLRTSQRFDGASLRPVIAGDNQAIARFTARVRFTETGFRTPRIADGDFNERSVLGDTAAFFPHESRHRQVRSPAGADAGVAGGQRARGDDRRLAVGGPAQPQRQQSPSIRAHQPARWHGAQARIRTRRGRQGCIRPVAGAPPGIR
jgi:hypothetical protein